MSTLVKCQPDHVLVGDQILIKDSLWTVNMIDGPDRIGTFDFYLKNNSGESQIVFATELVTIAR